MGTSTKKSYSSRFKAKVALEATDGNTVEELSDKYGIPTSKIEAWKYELKDRAELLFIDTENTDETLKSHAALLRSIIEASPNGIIVTDLDREIITYNRKSVTMWGLTEQVEKTGSLKKVMPHIFKKLKNPDHCKALIDNSYDNPEEHSNDLMILKDGRYFERTGVPYQVGNKIIGKVIHYVDITRFKETEEKLSRFADLLDSINTNVNEGILRSTPNDGLVYVNDAFVRMFGYDSKEEVMSTNPSAFYADSAVRQSLVDELEDKGEYINTEVSFKRKDGTTFWGLENSSFIQQEGKTYIDGVITDIDERKKAEQALRESEEKYRTILGNIEEGYFETDLEGNFTFFNAALTEMMGYSSEQMMGMNNRAYMTDEEAEIVFETFNSIFETGEPANAFDWELISGDGSRIIVESTISLRRDADDNPVGFRGVVRDISDRKKKQREIQNSLREKEVLLDEIHHRVKNNLAVISGLLFLQSEETDDKNAQRALKESQNRINSMALIHELLYDNETFASLNPSDYIEQLVAHVSSNMQVGNKNIRTKIEAKNFDLGLNTAIPCALIINELITNAHKYAFDGRENGNIQIIFRKEEKNGYHLEVADDGCGLPEDFDINDRGQHSLGLSLVKTLSQQLNGILYSENENGARFVIRFKGE
jgi:PAS domain S-box-containing protein